MGTLSTGCKDNAKILVVAMRGRGDDNQQRLETQKDGNTNSLTSVQKDNLIVHNMMPRSGDPKKGGTGHLSKNDGTTYNIDTNTNTNTIEMGSQIRRLTPVECARLQGFPDDWCKDISESQAYRCYGNAVTVAITKLIFEKLYATEAKIKP